MRLPKSTWFIQTRYASHLALWFFLLGNSISVQAQSGSATIDSLKTVINSAKHDSTIIKAYWQWDKLIYNSDPELDLKLNLKVYSICEQNLQKKLNTTEKKFFWKATATNCAVLSLITYFRGDYKKAIFYSQKSIAYHKKTNNQSEISICEANLGLIYAAMGNYPEALKHSFIALKIREKYPHKIELSICYNNLGTIYTAQQNHEMALKYFLLSIDLCKEVNYTQGLAHAYVNIGNIYNMQKKSAPALANFQNGLKLLLAMEDYVNVGTAYINIGSVFHQRGDSSQKAGNTSAAKKFYREGEKYYFLGVESKINVMDQQGLVLAYSNLGSLYVSSENFQGARKYLYMGLKLALEIGVKERIRDTYSYIYKLDSLEGKKKNAFNHYKLFIAYKDSLMNEEATKKSVQSLMQYEFDKKRATDSTRNAEKTHQARLQHAREIQQQKTYAWIGGLGFLLMVIVAIVSFRAYRHKQKTNRVIAEQKEILEEKQKEILDSIYYARRIQRSLLPQERYIFKSMENLTRNK